MGSKSLNADIVDSSEMIFRLLAQKGDKDKVASRSLIVAAGVHF